MTRDGKFVGELVSATKGTRLTHEIIADGIPGHLAGINGGDVVAMSIFKDRSGKITSFGSSTFPPQGGMLSDSLKRLAELLVD